MVETITVKTKKMGGSVAVIIPSFYAKLQKISAGDVVVMQIEKKGGLDETAP